MKKLLIFILVVIICLSLVACDSASKTPFIGDNGNWWIGEEDTNVPAQGEKGKDGKDGTNGTNGTSVTVSSVSKTSTEGLVDTYTILFSDGTSSDFTVTNGESNVITDIELTNTSGIVDTYTITFTNGSTKTFSVTNGKDISVLSIELESSVGLIDTYVVNYSDNSKYNFVVSNGADGLTPYIGENGNWWIGDDDTQVLADWEKANTIPLTFYSNGLEYEIRTIAGKSGFVVTGWDCLDFDDSLPAELGADVVEAYYSEEGMASSHLVIPNYIGSVPVIGIAANANLNFGKVTLSCNTVWIGDEAFLNCSRLKEIDFNNANIKQIPYRCFKGTALTHIELPSSVIVLQNEAFSQVMLLDFDLGNIKYIGNRALDYLIANYVYIPESVEYVGSNAFEEARVYLEATEKPASWASLITSYNNLNSLVNVNCKINDEYIYSIDGNEVTVYQYIGSERRITVPSKIDEKPVTKIGYGFASIVSTNIEDTVSELLHLDLDDETYLSAELISYVNPLDVIILPEGVKEIGPYTFYSANEIVFIPASIESVYKSSFASIDDDFGAKYLVFNGNNMPNILENNGEINTSITKEQLTSNTNYTRVAFGVDTSKLEFDDLFCYQNDGLTYSVFAYLGLRTDDLTIPSTFNNKDVTTVLSKAIRYENFLNVIRFSDGIERIRPYAVYNSRATRIYIPVSVLIINEYGIHLCGSQHDAIYVEANDKPIDWDSNWTNRTDYVVYGVGEVLSNAFFEYTKKNDKIALVRYIGSSSNIYIPSTLDNCPVTEIKKLFYSDTEATGAYIYIPSSVTTIREKAFNTSNGKTYRVYAYAESKHDGWDSQWLYGSGNKYYNWNQMDLFNYEFDNNYVYFVNGDEVTLCAYAGSENIVYIPTQIKTYNVTTIKGYCFTFTKSTSIYIHNSITTIENIGFDVRTNSSYCYFYCEIASKPSGWNNNWYYNSKTNSTAYCNIYFSSDLEY